MHQAAIPSVQRSIRDPVATNRANVTATLNILEACRKQGVRKVVYAASSSAYGNTPVLPKREDMTANPLSPYGLQKLVGERYCQLYYQLFGLETVSLRYFNVFGPGQDPHSEYSAVIPKFISRLIAGQSLTVYGDGEQSRDFTYVANVVEANLQAVETQRGAGEVFNVGFGGRISLNQMIKHLENIMGVTATIDYLPARKGDVRYSLADIDKARDFIGYDPKIGFEEGLRRTVEFFKNPGR
jgi:nucleoside-diphosphate-sugar epimerase